MKSGMIGYLYCMCAFGAFAVTVNKGDINQDLNVNLTDFAHLAEDWQTAASRSDIVPDGIVNLLDLIQLGDDWLKSQNANNPQVTFTMTGAVSGEIVIELYSNLAPVTIENFINYLQLGYYEGLIFHHVENDLKIQTGRYEIDLEYRPTDPPIVSESSNGLSNLRGTVAMDRSTLDPDSATSQFFINHADNIQGTANNLDYGEIAFNANDELFVKTGYCVFGRVVSGMEVVDAIAAVPIHSQIAGDGKLLEYVPVDDIIIQTTTLTEDIPFCAEKLDGDVDGNCTVNLPDFVRMAQNWLTCNSLTPACLQ